MKPNNTTEVLNSILVDLLKMAAEYHDSPATKAYICKDHQTCTCIRACEIRYVESLMK